VSPFGEFIPLRREGLRGRIFQDKTTRHNKLNMTSPCTPSVRGIRHMEHPFEIF
jgi:hypothetical protein